MEFAPTILNELFDSEDDNLDVQQAILESAVVNEDGRIIPHTILMKHEDYPDDDVMVDCEGRKWVTLDRLASLQEAKAVEVNRLIGEKEFASAAHTADLVRFENQIAELRRAFRDTFATLAFSMPSKEEFNAWYDRNEAVLGGVIAARRKSD